MTQSLQLPSLILFANFCRTGSLRQESILCWRDPLGVKFVVTMLYADHQANHQLQIILWSSERVLEAAVCQIIWCRQMNLELRIDIMSVPPISRWLKILAVMFWVLPLQFCEGLGAFREGQHDWYRWRMDQRLWTFTWVQRSHPLFLLRYSLVRVSQCRQALDLWGELYLPWLCYWCCALFH